MAKIEFTLNGRAQVFEGDPETPLLWVIRESCGLTGTKYGCGMAACGACTVHLDGIAIRACVKPVKDIRDRHVRTIEGLSEGGDHHPVQKAWAQLNVPQCGYCQSGQIMSAVALLNSLGGKVPTDEQIDRAMSGNLCRCGTYPRIRSAIKRAAKGTAR